MIISTTFALTLLLIAVNAAPSSENEDLLVVTKDFFSEDIIKYTSTHDIVRLVVPLNGLNFDDDSDNFSTENDDGSALIFFVEADIDDKGNKDYKGLYVFKKNVATKLLENGRGAAPVNDDSKNVFLAATDGLYVYNVKENKAEKYGTLNDNIIDIEKENSSSVLYIITANHELYKVTEEGTKKTKVEGVGDAQRVVLDYSDNIYYYGEDKQPYVINAEGVKKISGLPENPSSVTLIKPPFVLDDCVAFVSDDKGYYLYANGTSRFTEFVLEAKPTAYGIEATLVQYFAYNKRIYEINIVALILGEMKNSLDLGFLKDKKESVKSLATRSRSQLHP
ncbi:uncharacterized protein LOC131855489 [Achroia grisella]|uniref:uncharacterized protein LOC131855489 n=1 Tax=Achroia grisella TaxID=688607 RepID=UPI0027D2CE3D|nr:uncharacterized protein LOC131855489 [Achroia grisella]